MIRPEQHSWGGRPPAVLVLAIAAATIGGALVSQHVFGLVPCKLCLWQRWPYYLGIPLAGLAIVAPRGPVRRVLYAGLAATFLVSLALGLHHAGVEWGWWLGPSDCGGGTGPAPRSVEGLLEALQNVRVVNCNEAGWRWLGLSLAGWNAIVSAGLAAIAAKAAAMR